MRIIREKTRTPRPASTSPNPRVMIAAPPGGRLGPEVFLPGIACSRLTLLEVTVISRLGFERCKRPHRTRMRRKQVKSAVWSDPEIVEKGREDAFRSFQFCYLPSTI
jgi:hypothetical protein